MACVSFTDLRTATESLGQRIYKRARLTNLWFDAIKRSTYPKGTGTTQTTFTMKNSHVPDLGAWEDISLDVNGQPASGTTPANCPTNYVDIGVGFYERTYKPRRLKIRGPVICRDQLTYQHNVVDFLNGYERQLVKVSRETLEFAWRNDYIGFSNIWSDGVKYAGPNALATVVPPGSDLTQGQLDLVAADLVKNGATDPDDDGYIMNGGAGTLWTLEIDPMASQRILKNNVERRQDARWAMPNELWRKINATTIIANFRHAVTFNTPRFNLVGGVVTQVTTFKTASQQTSDGDEFTAAYKAAPYGMAIVIVPSAFEAEIVTPETWNYKTTRNYMGEWDWIEGGERIQTGCYDPEHNMAQHYARFEYAPKPVLPFQAEAILYQRPAKDVATADLYSTPGS